MPLHLYRLVRAMQDRGFAAKVLSLGPVGPVGQLLKEEGVDVLTCEGRNGWDVRILGRFRRIIEAVRPDILHTFLFHANVAGRYAAHVAGLPVERIACEIQTVEIERRWHLWVDRLTHWGCRFTIGNSPSVVSHLNKKAGIPSERLRLVRGGIDPALYREAQPAGRSTLGLAANDRVVFWAGRLDPVKGLFDLVTAFAEVAKLGTSCLLLAGEGPLRGKLQQRIESLGLSASVQLLGSRRDVPSLLKLADVFAFPSRTEGLPNALLEAMAAGCPIVTTNVPGCRDLIQHGDVGLVVPPGDPSALASAIRRLLEDRGLAAKLGARAAAEVSTNWHLRSTYTSYAALYEELMRPS